LVVGCSLILKIQLSERLVIGEQLDGGLARLHWFEAAPLEIRGQAVDKRARWLRRHVDTAPWITIPSRVSFASTPKKRISLTRSISWHRRVSAGVSAPELERSGISRGREHVQSST
jgi:hypothetical protein